MYLTIVCNLFFRRCYLCNQQTATEQITAIERSTNNVDNKYSNDNVLILDLDIQGAIKLKTLDLKIDFIALLPPSFDILKERLIKRGTENIDQINKRIEIGKKELNEIENIKDEVK